MTPLDHVHDITNHIAMLDSPEPHLPASVLSNLPQTEDRATDLVVARESDEHDHVLMDGCIQHTLSFCRALPGHSVAARIGIGPLLEPERFRGDVAALTEIRLRGTRAVLFLIEGTYFLYCEASAAKKNHAGQNQFTAILVNLLERIRPRHLHAASLSRFVRSFEQAGYVQASVTRNVDVVHSGDTSMVMRGEGQQTGHLLWSTLATISASERNLIVQRLAAGVVAKYQRGEWTIGSHSVPVGYTLDNGVLTVDETQAETVALAWTLLATPGLSARRIVQDLGDAGVSTLHMRRRHGPSATVADLKSPDKYIRHLLRYAPLYLTGVHQQRLANPFPGAQHLASLPVQPPSPRYENGHVEFTFRPGVPDGGWVDAALIEAAVDLRAERFRLHHVPPGHVGALSGITWVEGESLYRISKGAGTDNKYEIRARRIKPGPQP